MGREATRVFQIIAFVAPLLSGQALAQGSSGDEDYRRLWIEERRETTVCQVNAELLEAYLVDVDCQLEFAYDGEETLEKVASFKPAMKDNIVGLLHTTPGRVNIKARTHERVRRTGRLDHLRRDRYAGR